jgi:hypothetical protein
MKLIVSNVQWVGKKKQNKIVRSIRLLLLYSYTYAKENKKASEKIYFIVEDLPVIYKKSKRRIRRRKKVE